MQMSNPTYVVRDLELEYISRDGTVTALKNMNLTIQRGKITLLVGPSGSGKSSLLHCLTGLLRPTKGAILFEGKDVTALSPRTWTRLRRNKIHVMTQQTILIPYLTVMENLQLTMQTQNKSELEMARHYLQRLNLSTFMNRYPKELSIGGRQRIAIIRAMLGAPSVVLADEPTAALDFDNSHLVMELLADLAETGVAVVVATHDSSVMPFGDACLTMRDGEVKSFTHGRKINEGVIVDFENPWGNGGTDDKVRDCVY